MSNFFKGYVIVEAQKEDFFLLKDGNATHRFNSVSEALLQILGDHKIKVLVAEYPGDALFTLLEKK